MFPSMGAVQVRLGDQLLGLVQDRRDLLVALVVFVGIELITPVGAYDRIGDA